MAMEDFSPHQQRIIKRYYAADGGVQLQRLQELVTELYLAEGAKRKKLWQTAAAAMKRLGLPDSRINHLLEKDSPELLAKVVKELQSAE
ncbi:hypothetical protein [Tuwongella immobilis]|uniref:Uncharacterized protein n=1 Tax=Tuwongella immobilis TaxID=692036 RepID=A0A6C2YSN3_9BACT|nr:hypothetical protein [Tuwongella immobilis]VIP04153.1 Uncharacterized protein OS=Singulisphaera acidiphila (strain ATCC BAA-1392 / DSM 18658 / VKM B-2454 / MOB10) GN=Sinac_3024 PE=4 SV=1 [Tuwongella immobilis]VTS05671.1 Uncharacterized protein OS=Singulisphaera acidiphila (strain ATCC BAA-1392 / DSM 18658 / VKM B-2454 / MOB10) GN=Sinac_3024 PE=4 SV=1 [Tuwongella immobilis]